MHGLKNLRTINGEVTPKNLWVLIALEQGDPKDLLTFISILSEMV